MTIEVTFFDLIITHKLFLSRYTNINIYYSLQQSSCVFVGGVVFIFSGNSVEFDFALHKTAFLSWNTGDKIFHPVDVVKGFLVL